MGFLRWLWCEYRKERRIVELEYRRNGIMDRINTGMVLPDENVVREWALLNHEIKLLRNPGYARQRRAVDKRNRERGIVAKRD